MSKNKNIKNPIKPTEDDLSLNIDEIINQFIGDDDIDEDLTSDEALITEDYDDIDEECGVCDNTDIDIDEDNMDIVIEIDENDKDDIFDINPKKPVEFDIDIDEDILNETDDDYDSIILSKHSLEGKHSLKHDSIFKGKKDEINDELDDTYCDEFYKDNIEVDKTSDYYTEFIENESYIRTKRIKEKVYEVLKTKTSICFKNNRRKPSKMDFNTYYDILKENLIEENFTNIELFNELAFYFSDNLFNMFKLLDKKWRNIIISELENHIGKTSHSKEIYNKNIFEGTEVEFEHIDEISDNPVLITGDVIETDYDNSTYKINSYEKIYEVHISKIKKILNNMKFKYNLNKLNNIDFL